MCICVDLEVLKMNAEGEISKKLRENGKGENARLFKIRRDFEVKYGAELSSGDAEGVLISRNYVLPHLLVYNVDPKDYQRFLHFTKFKAQNKGWLAFKLLLDLADAIEVGRQSVQQEQAEEKPISKVCGKPRGEDDE